MMIALLNGSRSFHSLNVCLISGQKRFARSINFPIWLHFIRFDENIMPGMRAAFTVAVTLYLIEAQNFLHERFQSEVGLRVVKAVRV